MRVHTFHNRQLLTTCLIFTVHTGSLLLLWSEMDSVVYLFKRIQFALESQNMKRLFLKPQQIQCLDHLLNGTDVLAALPTGYGKSLIFQLLPNLFPTKKSDSNNIVIVVCPLNSIIEDQIHALESRNLNVGVLSCSDHDIAIPKLFTEKGGCLDDKKKSNQIQPRIKNGHVEILFSHPESLLSEEGRKLLKSGIYLENVVAIVIDEAHCIDLW